VFVATMNLAAAFSGPYFAVYMLQALRLSYFEYTLISCAMTLTQFLTMLYWGRLADRVGNKRILSFCGWGVSIIPVLWLVSAQPLYLVLLQIYTGFVWAGFNLASASFMFDAVTPPKRGRCAAYQAIVTAVFVFAGALAGGAVAERLPAVFDFGFWAWHPASNLLAIFVVSSALRLIAVLCFLDWFREVREVEAITNRDLLFRIVRLQPAMGATFGLHEPPAEKRK
jgi:MFS family permease